MEVESSTQTVSYPNATTPLPPPSAPSSCHHFSSPLLGRRPRSRVLKCTRVRLAPALGGGVLALTEFEIDMVRASSPQQLQQFSLVVPDFEADGNGLQGTR
ncbi:hypothetical protein M0802_003421 [Mischocyttarus mexicanus]|nr:hypothetical protein M0802_003421 [Mischocyttarus mexicanus]